MRKVVCFLRRDQGGPQEEATSRAVYWEEGLLKLREAEEIGKYCTTLHNILRLKTGKEVEVGNRDGAESKGVGCGKIKPTVPKRIAIHRLSTSFLRTKGSIELIFRPQGTCQVYKSGACDQWLNMTWQEYRFTPRFVDNRYGMKLTEKLITLLMKAVNSVEDKQERCKVLIRMHLCQYVLPPCNEKNERYDICREDCEALFKECHSAMKEMLGASKYIFKEHGLRLTHAGVPKCTDYRFSHEYKDESTSCLRFGVLGE